MHEPFLQGHLSDEENAVAYKYVCSDAGMSCDVRYEDEDAARVRREAEEHIRRDHPQEAIRKDRAEAILLAGGFRGV